MMIFIIIIIKINLTYSLIIKMILSMSMIVILKNKSFKSQFLMKLNLKLIQLLKMYSNLKSDYIIFLKFIYLLLYLSLLLILL
jgi:hypothetical protein